MKDQIEEMAKDVAMSISWCDEEILTIDCLETATLLYDKGYRKQSEGEWKLHKDGSGTCSECHFIQKDIWDYDHYQHFCGHCGAKMKGGAE